MDIGFTEEQELLRDTARKFLDGQCTTKFVREMMATDTAVTGEFWQKLADQGWLGIAYSETDGGSGLGLVDLVVLMEEVGRAVMPGPYPATVLLGGAAIAEAGSAAQRQEWLPRIASGEVKATLAVTEPNVRWDASGVTVTAREERGGYTLSGTKLFVPDANLADVLVVAARTRDGSTMEDGISLFLVPKGSAGVVVRQLPSVDETRKVCEVRLDNVTLPGSALLGELHQGWKPLSRVLDRAAVALAAEMCGAAQKVLEITVDYAKIRTTFGKPIGSYQGVKHKCSDMLVEIENAKSLTYYAAWAVDEEDADAVMAVSMAKAAASDAGRKVCAAGIQLHGGIGMTWEHDLHLYLKRAKASEIALGDATWHRERIARLMGA
ncbi:MAG TPA: acyl-CoA dehydrogenase [Stellaceae bacterium]|jgi:alkylation response protein AidB-like acyl-CoA dehydrogenase|nr:acyl-CoA dehydrogenase [Stellaceae bacterium]